MSAEPHATISPSEVAADSFSQADDDALNGYICLVFPDSRYPVQVKSILLGRDTRLQDFLERNTDMWVTKQQPSSSPRDRQQYESAIRDRIPLSEDGAEDEYESLTEPRYFSLNGGICSSDINLHKTPEDGETFLAIHPPGDEEGPTYPGLTAISKRHLRLYHDESSECWVMEILGRNGAFLDDQHYEMGDQVQLEHMSKISVGRLNFRVLFEDENDSDLGSLAGPYSSYEEATDSVSDESEEDGESDSPSRPVARGRASSSSEESVDEQKAVAAPSYKNKITTKLKLKVPPKLDKPVKEEKQPRTPKEKVPKKPKETSEEAQKKILSLLQPGEEPGRRKGPGRPPANGLMSKREMKERQRALADAQKLNKEGSGVGRLSPGLDAGAETEVKLDADQKLIRKKRKRGDTIGDSKADSADRKMKQSPEKSPEPTEDQFTPEQLAPPGLTYVVIIYRILQEVSPLQLNLQQLYREMKKRYPYYRFRPKPGWESSVRHTVSAENFIKGEKDGKGYKYTYNPDKPPAPQKQKQVTTPSNPTNYHGYGPPPPPGQFQPGNFPSTSYSNPYANAPQQNPYSHLPLHSQRPLSNGASQPAQPSQLQPSAPPISQTRNPQNSPYPINPSTLLQSGQQSSLTNDQSRLHTSSQNSTVQQPGAISRPELPNLRGGGVAPATDTQPNQHNESIPTQSQMQANASTSQISSQSTSQSHQQPNQATQEQISSSNAQSTNTTQVPSVSRPTTTQTTAQPTSSVSQAIQQNPQAQSSSRPPSQPESGTSSRPKTPFPQTPSEMLAQGRFPRVMLEFENNMRKMATNMNQKQQEVEEQAISRAMAWVKANPHKDFKPEPGMDSYTVSIIMSLTTIIKKQDGDILRDRQTNALSKT